MLVVWVMVREVVMVVSLEVGVCFKLSVVCYYWYLGWSVLVVVSLWLCLLWVSVLVVSIMCVVFFFVLEIFCMYIDVVI